MDWTTRRGTVKWPARSPDLTPLDFFLWVVMKHRFYSGKINDIDHLKPRINDEINTLRTDKDPLRRVCASVTGRVRGCIRASGGYFKN